MATILKKPVSREIEDWARGGTFGLNGKDAKRNLVVTLLPCGIINFRLKGLQSDYEIDIGRVFGIAAKETVAKDIQAEKRDKQIQRDAAG